jgi:ArpU family phage transcriptional regulator
MKQEIKHIKAILKDYARLKRDLKAFSQVSSPVLSSAPAHTRKNGVELSMINHVDLAYKLKQVEDAINGINDQKLRIILVDYVLAKHHCVSDYCQKWQWSKSKFNYMKNKALIEFSEQYKKLVA